VTMKHAIAPLLESTGKLHGGRVPQVCASLQDYFRDITDHLVRLNQNIDAVRDMVITAISVNLSMITLEESKTMKQLAAYAALVAVPTLIAGIYGMNFEHMPELEWLFGYPMVLAVMAAIDFYIYWKLKKARWL
jgi:magnesium transporter